MTYRVPIVVCTIIPRDLTTFPYRILFQRDVFNVIATHCAFHLPTLRLLGDVGDLLFNGCYVATLFLWCATAFIVVAIRFGALLTASCCPTRT